MLDTVEFVPPFSLPPKAAEMMIGKRRWIDCLRTSKAATDKRQQNADHVSVEQTIVFCRLLLPADRKRQTTHGDGLPYRTGDYFRGRPLDLSNKLLARVPSPQCGNGFDDHRLQDFLVHVGELFDVETGSAGGVFAEFGEQRLSAFEPHQAIENGCSFSR